MGVAVPPGSATQQLRVLGTSDREFAGFGLVVCNTGVNKPDSRGDTVRPRVQSHSTGWVVTSSRD